MAPHQYLDSFCWESESGLHADIPTSRQSDMGLQLSEWQHLIFYRTSRHSDTFFLLWSEWRYVFVFFNIPPFRQFLLIAYFFTQIFCANDMPAQIRSKVWGGAVCLCFASEWVSGAVSRRHQSLTLYVILKQRKTTASQTNLNNLLSKSPEISNIKIQTLM